MSLLIRERGCCTPHYPCSNRLGDLLLSSKWRHHHHEFGGIVNGTLQNRPAAVHAC